ncbi:hypothetical protein KK083_28060 [Fulvivirgaceae bacterium PWU4]|uniref:Uncharacterized protein n=1 Tax=Chryseosolibacter histidini TaxID=2782349 RepID=A0AAP2GR40_9BACT|nr:hypothetical protein [Chryseosolibacter histidini]MBT1700778.1 hypothetical protein [Chryseosolibacter histidini]
MEGIGLLILICFLITFAPPVIFFIAGLVKRRSNKRASTVLFILGTIWLIIGGGICASIMA